jgi:hypothetical protein
MEFLGTAKRTLTSLRFRGLKKVGKPWFNHFWGDEPLIGSDRNERVKVKAINYQILAILDKSSQ